MMEAKKTEFVSNGESDLKNLSTVLNTAGEKFTKEALSVGIDADVKIEPISNNLNTTTDYNQETLRKEALWAKASIYELNEDSVVEIPKVAWGYVNSLTGDIDGVIGTMGNFSLIIGKAKSKKTRYLNIALAAAISKSDMPILGKFKSDLPSNKNTVLYFDTEQSKHHVKSARDRICRQAGINNPPNLKVYGFRTLQPSERLELIEFLIYETPNVGFVVIDGIKDLMRKGINDEEESIMISSKLLKWTEERNNHIVTVLHQNKGNEHARGHIGSELINKAETVLSVTLSDKDDSVSIVEAQFSRDRKPEVFAFKVGDDGLAEEVEDFKRASNSGAKRNIEDYREYQMLMQVFSNTNSGFTYTPLTKAIREISAEILGLSKPLGGNAISDLIKKAKEKGWLTQEATGQPYCLGDYTATLI